MATQAEAAKSLYEQLEETNVSESAPALSKPKNGYDNEAHEIYQQAHRHRDKLINFYIAYTIGFSVIVAILVIAQAHIRTVFNNNFEVMPQWTLNLLITGMFIQFIGLLKIVTGSVWDFKSFFAHHSSMQPTAPEKDASNRKMGL